MREFAAEAFEALTNADSRLWRTVRTLLTQPGELTSAYMRGNRVGFARPLQLFLLVNVFYLSVASVAGMRTYQTPLNVHMNQTVHKEVARGLVAKRLRQGSMTEREYAQAFDRLATVYAKSLIIVMVPIWAMFAWAVHARGGFLGVHHLVFSLHFFAMVLLLSVVQEFAVNRPLVVIMRGPGGQLDWHKLDVVATSVSVTVFGAYLHLALRRTYGDGAVGAAVRALVLVAGYMMTLFAYRAILFFVAYWSI